MSRGVLILIVLGVAAAILLGIYAVTRDENSQANAQASFCSSLESMESDVQALVSLDPSSASKSDYEDAVDSIQSDWDDVKSDASNLASIDMSTLDGAWDDFKSAVDDVPDDASVSDALSDVGTAAQSLVSTTQSTLNGPDCSSSS
jgi:hypothetical protein